ncbi:MAG: helix-turn-helix transcriptional regulator [Clostridiales bacterium]|nr:helix-turn-helix transcriptional regulator [Clostridiales bacterium]
MADDKDLITDLEIAAAEGEDVLHEHAATVKLVKAEMPNEDVLMDIAELFKVFGDSTRTKILAALAVSECCVACISAVLNMSVSAVSHQLRILRQSKLVKTRREGKEIYYSLDDEHIGRIFETALEHIKEL